MKYKLLTLCLSAALLTPIAPALADTETKADMVLDQVLVLSRHNLRTPIVNTGILTEVTDKNGLLGMHKVDISQRKVAHLKSMGHYFREWIDQNKLLADELCPTSNEDIYLYTNSLQRTIATAQFLQQEPFLDAK